MVKEYETEFHDNPNYFTAFAFTLHANGYVINMCVYTCNNGCSSCTNWTRCRDKFATIEEEKDLEEDSANFIITMCNRQSPFLASLGSLHCLTVHVLALDCSLYFSSYTYKARNSSGNTTNIIMRNFVYGFK